MHLEIAKAVGADYLKAIDRERMNAVARVGNPRIERFCNACFTGEYPTGDVTKELLESIAGERCESQGQVKADEVVQRARVPVQQTRRGFPVSLRPFGRTAPW